MYHPLDFKTQFDERKHPIELVTPSLGQDLEQKNTQYELCR